jgi:hypothetical protein
MAALGTPQKRLSKSILSMFLRTKCDRELYLSLHEGKVLESFSMPIPLQARPGIGVLQTAGRDFEQDRNQQLIAVFGSAVIFQTDSSGKPTKAPIESLLSQVKSTPSLLLQAKFEPKAFQPTFLTNIGLEPSAVPLIPRMDGMIPDVILVRDPIADDEEVLPTGSRKPIDSSAETRKALSVLDIKHTSEANPSYSAEVALYALSLANWLAHTGLHTQYFVAVNCFLWTRFKQGASALDLLQSSGKSHSSDEYVKALLDDSEDANLRFYLPTVLHFFREDLPRVIQTGDANVDGWKSLEWHVDGRCSACDWLGHQKWANFADKQRITAHPDHYCYPAAKLSGHLSQIAGMTRGARKTLKANTISDVSMAAATPSTHSAYDTHTHLKKERHRIPARASALLTNITTTDSTALLASLAPYPQMHVAIAINFDPSAGLLTGLSIVARTTTYTTGQSPKSFVSRGFVVDQKDLNAEWVALEGLLSTLSDITQQSEQFVQASGKPGLTAQISFWEERQFHELCAAMGRHLPKILALVTKKTRALAWLFPADELLEKPDGAVSPCIVFVDEIVKRVVFAPTPHVITLFDTAELYYAGPFPVRQSDAYYREFLTNGIPRERIYEIWSNASTIKRGSVTVPRNTVISEFHNALDKQCRALNSVVEKLRSDFKGQLKANAPRLSLTVPQGAKGVAFDAKLWIWWDELEYQTRRLASHQVLALDATTLEATYDAIRLSNGKPTATPGEFTFDIRASSTEAKLDSNDAFLALGKEGRPGLPLARARDILSPNAPAYVGKGDTLLTPMWSSLSVHLKSLDRAKRKATIRFSSFRDPAFVPYILAHSQVDLLNDVFVMRGQAVFKWYEKSREILLEVGNPPIATPDLNSAAAMGMQPGSPGTSTVKPLARVLWDAPPLQSASVIPSARAQGIAQFAEKKHSLNPSQRDAVQHACEKKLTVIWGPPGTGKTKVLAACTHALVHEAAFAKKGLKILISGPTYKAVEELVNRVVSALNADPNAQCSIFLAYSQSTVPSPLPSTSAHLKARSFNLTFFGFHQETQECLDSLNDPSKITIVATSTLQAYKFAEKTTGSIVAPVFDVVIIDESSQVQVTQAISPCATLKSDARLIIAGDQLQMPPITSLEPPVNAEYLVGSIQSYLLKRNKKPPIVECPLEENYRSAEHIVAYERSIGYRPTLKAAHPDTKLKSLSVLDPTKLPAGLPWSPLFEKMLDPEIRVLSLLHDDDLSSQSNEHEARMVASLVWALRSTMSAELDCHGKVSHSVPTSAQFWDKCVGVVTPHRAQRALVARELKAIFPNDSPDLIDAAVDTVEKFQGGERHTIIVTFAVGDADVISGEEAFLMQLERTNVAVSRAMAKSIVIMPMTLAGHVPQDKKALETAHAIKDYVDEFCNKEAVGQISVLASLRNAKLRFHG